MDHPKCRDCGERHRLGAEFCPLFKKDEPKITAKKLKEVMPYSDSSSRLRAGPEQHIGLQADKAIPQSFVAGGKFDRVAYQREYMRRYRMKKKESR